ncbi:MAG: caspase family protein [Hyphomicrobiales bacterium]|nr:caspase family protein [Hyphomicrobiales bacterium]
MNTADVLAQKRELMTQVRLLTDLHQQGLISDEEYKQRKKAILDSVFTLATRQDAGGSADTGGTRAAGAEAPAAKEEPKTDPMAAFADVEFGSYHALVIGNNAYEYMPKLHMAETDARAVAKVLKRDYGFKTRLLINATRRDILAEMAHLRRSLTEGDNLLIYYAGHGILDEDAERGYWLPVDAEEDIKANWISTADITDALKATDAWHVLVIADSCYSGTLVRAGSTRVIRGGGDRVPLIKRLAIKKSRTVLTSGGLEPVKDSGGGDHSVFAKAFLDALTENADVMEGQEMFTKLRGKVVMNADQTPEYADVRKAGHDGGDFVFVRKRR